MDSFKTRLRDLLVETLQKEELLIIEAAKFAREGATDPESKADNKYDTRGLELSYLAGAQAKRALDIKEDIHRFQNLLWAKFNSKTPIDLTAVVTLESEEGDSKTYLLLPCRGGLKLTIDAQEIFTLSEDGPIAQALIGRSAGDSFELKISGVNRGFAILKVR